MPNVQAVGRGVEAGVDAATTRGKPRPNCLGFGGLMHEATGLKVCKQIRSHDGTTPFVVVFIARYHRRQTGAKGRRAWVLGEPLRLVRPGGDPRSM